MIGFFYGVLNFILLTTITRNLYLVVISFILLGIYISYLENLSAMIVWYTTSLVGMTYILMKVINKYFNIGKLISFLFSNTLFVFIIFFFTFLIVISSVYFWSGNYGLPLNIKNSIFDSLVSRGKIIENSLVSLDNLKDLFLGVGWGVVPDLLIENMNPWQYEQLRLGHNLHFHTHNELAEHIVSLGLLGGIFYLVYIYF